MNPSAFVWAGGERGGYERRMLGLADALHRNGCEVTVGGYTPMPSVRLAQLIIPSAMRTEKLRGYDNLIISTKLTWQRRFDAFDIVIGWFLGSRRQYTATFVGGDSRAFSRHGAPLSRAAYLPLRMLADFGLRRTSLCVTGSRAAERYLHDIGVTNVLSSTHFVDTRVFRRFRRARHERFRVLFVGRDDPIKNLGSLMEACAALGEPVELHVVGMTGQDREGVRYHGWVSGSELCGLYNASDLTALPSHYETFGMAVVESLACGTPVLTTRMVTASEELDGWVELTQPDAPSIREAIERIRGDYGTVKARALDAARHIERHFDERMVLDNEARRIIARWQSSR